MIIEKTKKLLRFGVYMLLPMLGGAWVGVSCTDTWDEAWVAVRTASTRVPSGLPSRAILT